MIGIYKITSPSKKTYIGQSNDILYRWHKYQILNCKQQVHLYRSFLKHGVENHKFEIIEECSSEELNEKEKYYVDLFQTFNSKHGMNLKDGGGSKGKHSKESIDKIRKGNTGKKRTPEQIKNLKDRYKNKINPLKGKNRSKEVVENLKIKNCLKNNPMYGKTHSLDTKIKISKAMRGRGHKQTKETKNKISLANKGKEKSGHGIMISNKKRSQKYILMNLINGVINYKSKFMGA